MAFANLFTRLSAVEENVKSSGPPAHTCRNETLNGQRGRKWEAGQTTPHKKKQCYQTHMTRTDNATLNVSEDKHHQMYNTDSENASVGFNKKAKHSHMDTAGCNNMSHKGQNYKTKNNRNVNKQQKQQKKWKGQRNHHHQKDRGRPAFGGESHQSRPLLGKRGWDRTKEKKQGFQVKQPRFMTQEFKDQNVLSVDGRLLCRHFIWGKCIKGDDCQLEHAQGYNDLIKESCKFYIQGFCTKGETCPYMHKSFPCKFFHSKGKCSQGADCRFSHDPLNEVTKRLLDEALKRDKDLFELAKKAEQESPGQPANTDNPVIAEANGTPDIFLQPLRPNFYKCADTNAEKEALLCQTDGQADNMEEDVLPPTSDAALPQSPLSTNPNVPEPVCYSVEAVLGPQLSKPFPSFFTTPKSQESASLSSSYTSGSANQSQIPYSVDAVLRSYKSVENYTFGHTSTPPTAQTLSCSPKPCFEDIADPLLSSDTPNNKYSVNAGNEVNKSQEKMFKGLISKTCRDLPPAYGDKKKQGGTMSESLKTAERASHGVKSELLSPDTTCFIYGKHEGVSAFGPAKHKGIFSSPLSQITASKVTKQLKPHLSVWTSHSQASFKPCCPSPGFKEFKGRAVVPAEPVVPIKSKDCPNFVTLHVEAKQPTEIHLHSNKTQCVLKPGKEQHYSSELTAECSSKMVHCGDLAAGCKKTLKRPFHSLFASNLTDTVQPKDDSITSSFCPQNSLQSSCPAPQSVDCRSNHCKNKSEPVKASARSFKSLFSAPLSAAPLPLVQSQPDFSITSICSQQSGQLDDNTSHSSDSKPTASDFETPIPHQISDVKEFCLAPGCSHFSPNAIMEKKDSPTEHVNRPPKQLENSIFSPLSDSPSEVSSSPTACGNGSSTAHAHRPLPDILSHIGSPVAATTNSVLKTLFLCLSPYRQDAEQQQSIHISVQSESEKRDKKRKTKCRRKKKLETQDSHKQLEEKTVVPPRELQPSLQTTQISTEATGGSTVNSPGMTERGIRNSELVIQHHIPPQLKYTSEEGKWRNGNVAVTPIKDLFKTLDTAVLHSEH